MADDTASFAVALDDSGLTGPANESAAALEKLRESIYQDTAALRQMQSALRTLKGATGEDAKASDLLRTKIDAQKASVQSAQARYVQLGGNFRRLPKPPLQPVTAGLRSLGEQAARMGGPLGTVVGRLSMMRGVLAGSVLVAGPVALAAALLAVAAAASVAIGKLVSYGIAVAEARRNEMIMLEGFTKIRFGMIGMAGMYGIAADKASFLRDQIDAVSASSSLSRDKVAGYTQQLYRMGLRAGNLQTALKGVTTVAAVQGDAQAKIWAQWMAGAAMTGQSVKALAGDIEARLGGLARQKMLSLAVQQQKLKENFAFMFSGLNIEPLLKAVSKVTELSSQQTASGRAMKAVFESLLQPLIDGIAVAAPLARRFFQGMIIGALLLERGILRLRIWFAQSFGSSRLLKDLDTGRIAIYAGAAAVGVLAGALFALVAPFALVVAIAYGAVRAFEAFEDVVKRAKDALGISDWKVTGGDLVKGLVLGMLGQLGTVIDAAAKLGGAAVDAIQKRLQMKSPSKLGIEIGSNLGGSIALGQQRSHNMVRAASNRLAAAAVPRLRAANDNARIGIRSTEPHAPGPFSVRRGDAGGAPGSTTGGAAARSLRVQIDQVIVQSTGDSGNAQQLAKDFRRELTRELRDAAAELGAA